MIKPNELRLGNWINLSANDDIQFYGKVLSIGSEEQQFEQVYCECDESFEWAFKDNYRGIPLTPEWLERFGFIEMTEHEFWKNDDYTFYGLGRDGDKFPISFNPRNKKYKKYFACEDDEYSFFGTPINYVHQLQNLYFALTGEELIFNPAAADKTKEGE